MNKQEHLLTILYDMSQTIGSEMHLHSLLIKTLQRLMYHTGYSCGLILSGAGKHQRLEVGIGERQLQKHLDESFNLPFLAWQNSLQASQTPDLGMLPVRQDHYKMLLVLPVPDYGTILLLGVEASQSELPFKQVFSPILANLSKTIRLCQHSEAYTAGLIADRDQVRSDNERFRQALDTSTDYIFLIDSESSRLIDFNLSATRTLGYSHKEMLKLHLHELITTCTPAFVSELLLRLESSAKGELLESSCKRKNGSQFPVEIRFSLLPQKNKSAALIAVVSDITERKLAEETLARAMKEWAFAMDFFEDAIYLIDLDDKLLRANQAFYKMTGLTPELAVGRDITTIMHPDGEKIPCPVCKARTERRDEVIVLEADHPDNPVGRPIQVTVQIIRNNKGSSLSVLMGVRDLSKIRQAEEEKIRLHHQLHQSQKMDALGKLTGGIAHDFNNMLGVIIGYSDLLTSALNEQPKQKEYAKKIQHAGERGAKLTRKLLAFSRYKASEASCLNINTLLLNEQSLLEKTLTVRIKLVLNLVQDIWMVWLDDSDLEDAMLNISINAAHAIKGNGQLTICTNNKQIGQVEAQALDLAPGDYVLLSISDTGCGMDSSIKEQIFEPFFSTKGEQGTGLGLSQVYGFVQRSGGAINVYSEPGHGTQITLYFPRHHKTGDKEPLLEENDVTNIKGSETILLVDDEPALLSLSYEILSQHGFNVLLAETAKNALAILEHETVDLLVSDIIMPEMDGHQLAAIVKEKYPAIKIQLTSGFTSNSNADLVDKSLQQNLLLKPYNSQALLQRIRDLLNEK